MAAKNDTEKSQVPAAQFLPMAASCGTIAQFYRSDTDTDAGKHGTLLASQGYLTAVCFGSSFLPTSKWKSRYPSQLLLSPERGSWGSLLLLGGWSSSSPRVLTETPGGKGWAVIGGPWWSPDSPGVSSDPSQVGDVGYLITDAWGDVSAPH